MSDYYQILGIRRNATIEEIKKAYKKKALMHHPGIYFQKKLIQLDRHSSSARKEEEEIFKKVGEAYSVLSDPEKRRMYDLYGEEGLKRSEEGGGEGFGRFSGFNYSDANSIFRNFFGGRDPFESFGFGRSRFFSDDFFNDPFFRDDPFFESSFKTNRRGPFMFQRSSPRMFTSRSRSPSPIRVNIEGGETSDEASEEVPEEKEVPSTKLPSRTIHLTLNLSELYTMSRKEVKFLRTITNKDGTVTNEESKLEFQLSPGIRDGSKLTFADQGDENLKEKNVEPGDVIVIIHIKPDEHFKLKDFDLETTIDVSLKEAITGKVTQLKLLDGRVGTVTIPPLQKSDYTIRVPGLGMPKNKTERGELIINCRIVMPTLTDEQKAALLKILP